MKKENVSEKYEHYSYTLFVFRNRKNSYRLFLARVKTQKQIKVTKENREIKKMWEHRLWDEENGWLEVLTKKNDWNLVWQLMMNKIKIYMLINQLTLLNSVYTSAFTYSILEDVRKNRMKNCQKKKKKSF